MKIYISLPITGYDLQECKSYAERLKKHLQLINPQAEIVTPFDVNPDQELSCAEYMGNDIAALLTSDAVYFCKGWYKSREKRNFLLRQIQKSLPTLPTVAYICIYVYISIT